MNNPWKEKMSVVALNPTKSGNIRAFVDVMLGNAITIRSIKIIQQPGQRAYVRLPEQQVGDHYYPVVEAHDQRFKDALSEVVLAAWEAHLTRVEP